MKRHVPYRRRSGAFGGGGGGGGEQKGWLQKSGGLAKTDDGHGVSGAQADDGKPGDQCSVQWRFQLPSEGNIFEATGVTVLSEQSRMQETDTGTFGVLMMGPRESNPRPC